MEPIRVLSIIEAVRERHQGRKQLSWDGKLSKGGAEQQCVQQEQATVSHSATNDERAGLVGVADLSSQRGIGPVRLVF